MKRIAFCLLMVGSFFFSFALNAQKLIVYKNDGTREEHLLSEIVKIEPHPFSNSTEVIYELADDCEIELTLYNICGMKVQNLANGKQLKGTHKLTLNSESLSSGSYNLILTSCGKSITEKVVVAK